MSKKRRRLWILLFIGVALLLSILATGWNIVLVHDYQYVLSLAHHLSVPNVSSPNISAPYDLKDHPTTLVIKMILGTSGFIAVLTLTVLLFIKLLSEMRLNQLQSDFLATVSHELKTPIATMELSSSLIRSGDLKIEEINALWTSHDEELKRLRGEVETLLEAARWQTKSAVKEKIPVLLENWINQSFDGWKNQLGPNALLCREGEILDLYASLDLKNLNLIINNLLSNARKFSQGTPHVIVRSKKVEVQRFLMHQEKWQIQFEDRGWGFDPAHSKKIFHRFFRSKNQAPYAIPGTGLGLYLAISASQAMGLSLRGESLGIGQGAVFTLEGSVSLL